ncbi:hypothetical protein ABT144_23890, partial [Streptomyces sp. NPDC002039]
MPFSAPYRVVDASGEVSPPVGPVGTDVTGGWVDTDGCGVTEDVDGLGSGEVGDWTGVEGGVEVRGVVGDEGRSDGVRTGGVVPVLGTVPGSRRVPDGAGRLGSAGSAGSDVPGSGAEVSEVTFLLLSVTDVGVVDTAGPCGLSSPDGITARATTVPSTATVTAPAAASSAVRRRDAGAGGGGARGGAAGFAVRGNASSKTSDRAEEDFWSPRWITGTTCVTGSPAGGGGSPGPAAAPAPAGGVGGDA